MLLIDFFEYTSKEHAFLLRVKFRYATYGVVGALFFLVFLFMFQVEPLPFVYFQF